MRLDVPPVPFYEGKDFFENISFPLAVVHTEQSRDYPVHCHDFTELVVVYGGSGTHVGPAGKVPVGLGSFFAIEPGEAHGYEGNRDLSYVNILVGLDSLADARGRRCLKDCIALSRGSRLSEYGTREALSLATRIDQEIFRKERGYELAATANFFLLVSSLARSAGPTGESTQARVRALARRIEANPSLPMSVEDMAREAQTSVRNFSREFRRITGASPIAFVNRARIEEAKALLRGTDKTVTQIAFLVGFEDSAYFSRAFRRIEGRSPSDCRARRGRGRGGDEAEDPADS